MPNFVENFSVTSIIDHKWYISSPWRFAILSKIGSAGHLIRFYCISLITICTPYWIWWHF